MGSNKTQKIKNKSQIKTQKIKNSPQKIIATVKICTEINTTPYKYCTEIKLPYGKLMLQLRTTIWKIQELNSIGELKNWLVEKILEQILMGLLLNTTADF